MKNGPGLVWILILVAGCGDESRTSRIVPGTSAEARGVDDRSVPAFFSNRTEDLPAGTVVKVLSDAEGKPEEARRKVVVSIAGGLAGQMFRSDLQPRN